MFSRFSKFPPSLFLLSMLVALFASGCDGDPPDPWVQLPQGCMTFVDDEMRRFALDLYDYDEPDKLPARSRWDKNHDQCIDPEEAAAVTSIGSATNVRLTSLDDLNQFPNLTTVRSEAFLISPGGSLHLDHVEVLESKAFGNCSFQTVDLPKVTRIGREAFKSCRNLESVSLPAIQSIDAQAFEECNALATLSELGIKRIEGRTFYGTGLKRLQQPHVELVATEAFMECSKLTSVELPKTKTVGDRAFYHCPILATVDLPNVAVIGKRAFASTKIKTLELPNATTIEDEAFGNCKELTSAKLPKAKDLGASIFDESDSLEHLELSTPDDIKLGKTIVSHPEQVDLVLHSNKAVGGSGKPKATDATHWGGYVWKSITFVD